MYGWWNWKIMEILRKINNLKDEWQTVMRQFLENIWVFLTLVFYLPTSTPISLNTSTISSSVAITEKHIDKSLSVHCLFSWCIKHSLYLLMTLFIHSLKDILDQVRDDRYLQLKFLFVSIKSCTFISSTRFLEIWMRQRAASLSWSNIIW